MNRMAIARLVLALCLVHLTFQRCAFGQATSEEALEEAKNAVTEGINALVGRKGYSGTLGPAVAGHLVQVGRAVFYLNQMTAMEKPLFRLSSG